MSVQCSLSQTCTRVCTMQNALAPARGSQDARRGRRRNEGSGASQRRAGDARAPQCLGYRAGQRCLRVVIRVRRRFIPSPRGSWTSLLRSLDAVVPSTRSQMPRVPPGRATERDLHLPSKTTISRRGGAAQPWTGVSREFYPERLVCTIREPVQKFCLGDSNAALSLGAFHKKDEGASIYVGTFVTPSEARATRAQVVVVKNIQCEHTARVRAPPWPVTPHHPRLWGRGDVCRRPTARGCGSTSSGRGHQPTVAGKIPLLPAAPLVLPATHTTLLRWLVLQRGS